MPTLTFTASTYHEEKSGDWIVRFSVMKDLNAFNGIILALYDLYVHVLQCIN